MAPPSFILASLLAAAGPEPNPVTVTGHFWAAFISPMGEPFRPHAPGEDMLAAWFFKADGNSDGVLTVDEMRADAERFFATLDTDHDGHIGSEELVRYEWEVAPDVQLMSRTRPASNESSANLKSARKVGEAGAIRKSRFRTGNDYGFEGAGRYALLDIPEPVAAADTSFDDGISLAEFRQAAARRFSILDVDRQGKLTLAGLEALLPKSRVAGQHPRNRKSPDTRIANPLPPGN
jgi:hypothetical protein